MACVYTDINILLCGSQLEVHASLPVENNEIRKEYRVFKPWQIEADLCPFYYLY